LADHFLIFGVLIRIFLIPLCDEIISRVIPLKTSEEIKNLSINLFQNKKGEEILLPNLFPVKLDQKKIMLLQLQ
jgi:hypothetical protein